MDIKFWLLFGSAIVVFCIAIPLYIFVQIKIRRLKKEYSAKLASQKSKMITDKGLLKVLSRPNAGQLLWDFDAKLVREHVPHLDAVEMEYLINIVIRNNYKNFFQLSANWGYELITLSLRTTTKLFYRTVTNARKVNSFLSFYNKKAKLNHVKNFSNSKQQFDIILLSASEPDLLKKFNLCWSKLAKKGMIVVTRTKSKAELATTKLLQDHLKTVGCRNETNKSVNNVLLIVK